MREESIHDFDPLEDLMIAVIRLWGLLSPQLGSSLVTGANTTVESGDHGMLTHPAGIGSNGSATLFAEKSEDVGVDIVPVRADSMGSEDEPDDNDYFLLDPTMMGGCIRPLYPSVAQSIVHLAINMMQYYVSEVSINYSVKSRHELAQSVCVQLKSIMRVMGILSSKSSAAAPILKTPAQQNLLLWLAPRLVRLHHLIVSQDSHQDGEGLFSEVALVHGVAAIPNFAGAISKIDDNDKTIDRFDESVSDLIDQVLTDITPQLRRNHRLAEYFRDVIYVGGNDIGGVLQCAPWRAWEMHMAGSRIFLEQKLCFESRIDWYRGELRGFVERLELRVDQAQEESMQARMHAMRRMATQQWNEQKGLENGVITLNGSNDKGDESTLRAWRQSNMSEGNSAVKSLRVQEQVRKQEAISLAGLRSVHTIQSIRRSLEELVYMHAGTPWAGLVPPSLKKKLYFWSIAKHETAQRMHHRLFRDLKRKIHRKVSLPPSTENTLIREAGKGEDDGGHVEDTEDEVQNAKKGKKDEEYTPLAGNEIPLELEYWFFLGGKLHSSNGVPGTGEAPGYATCDTHEIATNAHITVPQSIVSSSTTATKAPPAHDNYLLDHNLVEANEDEERDNIRSELAFSHRSVAAERAMRQDSGYEESGTEFATVAQLVLPMCTVHGRLELTDVSVYFYADGIAGAGLDDHMAASKQIDANALLKERWVDDEQSDSCHCCQKRIRSGFILSGKHHCRCCGNVVCSECSTQRCVLPVLGFSEAVRVCDICFAKEAEAKRSGGTVSTAVSSADRKLASAPSSSSSYSSHSSSLSSFSIAPPSSSTIPSTSVQSSSFDVMEANMEVSSPHKLQQLRNLRTRQILLSEINEVYSRRHLLRRSALELMTLPPSRKGYLFNFPGGESIVEEFFRRLMAKRPPRLFRGVGSSGIGRPGIFAKWNIVSRPQALLRECGWTKRWQSRQISNFEYLMRLNTIAGRTYNDLTQYPVFPWILREFGNDDVQNQGCGNGGERAGSIDLNDPSVYRDLSKPIGALNPKRLAELRERFEGWEDPTGGDAPAFLYGTHYSNVGSVLYFLSRMEPFTTYMMDLQGGEFDQPERMFHSLSRTWEGCMTNNSDLKELIPELFYMPECFKNKNGLDMGTMQDGTHLGDVKLPAWAHGSAEEFVRVHREALESDFVSANLHHWIDLIFGFKQTGDAAVAADNVFYYLTYEDAVDIDKIDDPIMRKAVEVQIANFGQCPSQLFHYPHPQRDPPAKVLLHDMARAANAFLQENLGRTIGDGLEKISNAVASRLTEGSVAHDGFTQASSALGGLLSRVGQVASHGLNMATAAITGGEAEEQESGHTQGTVVGDSISKVREVQDGLSPVKSKQRKICAMANTAGSLGAIVSIVIPRFGRDYECRRSGRSGGSSGSPQIHRDSGMSIQNSSGGVICEILAIDAQGLCCPFEFRLQRFYRNHHSSIGDDSGFLSMSLISPYDFSKPLVGESKSDYSRETQGHMGVFRVLEDRSHWAHGASKVHGSALWNQHNMVAVLPPYATLSSALSSRRHGVGLFDSSLPGTEARSIAGSAGAFLLSAGHWDWTFKASALRSGGESGADTGRGSEILSSRDTSGKSGKIQHLAPSAIQSVSHHHDVSSCVSVSCTYSYLTLTEPKGGAKRPSEERSLMPADSAVVLVGSADGTISVWPIHLPGVGSKLGVKGVIGVTQTKAGSSTLSGMSTEGSLGRWKRASFGSGSGRGGSVGSSGGLFEPLKKIKSFRLLRGVDGCSSGEAVVADADGPVQWLHGHESAVSALDADLDLGIVVSGSETGVCLVHDIYLGTFLVSLVVKDEDMSTSAKAIPRVRMRSKAIRIVRIVPQTSKVVVVTDTYVHIFTSSTGDLITACHMLPGQMSTLLHPQTSLEWPSH